MARRTDRRRCSKGDFLLFLSWSLVLAAAILLFYGSWKDDPAAVCYLAPFLLCGGVSLARRIVGPGKGIRETVGFLLTQMERQAKRESISKQEKMARCTAGEQGYTVSGALSDGEKWWGRYREIRVKHESLAVLFLSVYLFFCRSGLAFQVIYLVSFFLLRRTAFILAHRKFMAVAEHAQRPLTAATACLYMLQESRGRSRREIWYGTYSGSVFLLRAGFPGEALALLSNEKGGSAFRRLCVSRARQLCDSELGLWKEEKEEWERLDGILRTSPWLKGLERTSLIETERKVRLALLREDVARAVLFLELYLETCRDTSVKNRLLFMEAELERRLGHREKADTITETLLRYSPENQYVRASMEYGPCRYEAGSSAVAAGFFRRKKGEKRMRSASKAERCSLIAWGLIAIYGTAGLLGSFLYGLSPFIRKEPRASLPFHAESVVGWAEEKYGKEDWYQKELERMEQEETSETAESLEEERKGEENSSGTGEAEIDETGINETEVTTGGREAPDFQLIFPEKFRELVAESRGNGSRSYYQVKSMESMGDGFLFGIQVFDDASYVNFPDYEVWGYDGPYAYVVSRPTDVCFDAEDPETAEEYRRLSGTVESLKNQFRILSDTARYDGDEFVFPTSSQVRLTRMDVINLSGSQLRIAKNEIYARHGRRFQDDELQQYFSSCSWYEGTVAPEDFSKSILNETERANIQIIQKQQEEME